MVAFNVFNVGDTAENYTKQIASPMEEIANGRLLGCKSTVMYDKNQPIGCPRDYRVVLLPRFIEQLPDTLLPKKSRFIGDCAGETNHSEDGFLLNPDDAKYCNSPE